MKNSQIEWCDHTFNPWEGCTKVSPGCANCYAEARNKRWAGGANWGPGAPRRRTSESNWRQPLKWDREAKRRMETEAPWGEYRRPRVFCASLADWLDDEVPIEWLADLLELIRLTTNLDWLLLTKRPENWRARVCMVGDWMLTHGKIAEYGQIINPWVHAMPQAPVNVWIGTTVEDQKRADERIPLLLAIPAHVRFLSCEPLLGPVNLCEAGAIWSDINNNPIDGRGLNQHVHWVICGGESGPKARPMHPDWARSLRDQCQASGVPFLFKQWGEWLPACQYQPGTLDRTHEKAQHTFDADSHSWWVGKKAAGRMLDGREWSQFPEVKP